MGVALECVDLAAYVVAPHMTVAERLVTPRLGKLINEAYAAATGDVLAIVERGGARAACGGGGA